MIDNNDNNNDHISNKINNNNNNNNNINDNNNNNNNPITLTIFNRNMSGPYIKLGYDVPKLWYDL